MRCSYFVNKSLFIGSLSNLYWLIGNGSVRQQ